MFNYLYIFGGLELMGRNKKKKGEIDCGKLLIQNLTQLVSSRGWIHDW